MAVPFERPGLSSLTLRILSGLVMLPVAAAAIWIGGWIFAILVGIAAGLMYWEWQGLCGRKGVQANIGAVICALGPLVVPLTGPEPVIGAGLAIGIVTIIFRSCEHQFFLAGGFIYIFFASAGIVWLRGLDPAGMETILWLVTVVVLTDTCAYFTGRSLGGPKLAPTISPKKTWSGLVGGMLGAVIGAGIFATIIEGNIPAIAVMGGLFAVVAQIGDLAISKAKRAFDVKDSSNLIPGHGGVLDRFDGILSASMTMVILTLAAGGNPLTWL